MGSPKLARIIRLIRLLQAGRGTSTQELATSLECSRRTVFRDIKLLNASGLSIVFDNGRRCYFLEERDAMPLSPIGEDEHVALLVAAALSPVSNIQPWADHVRYAIVKLLAKASPQVRQQVNNLIGSMFIKVELPAIPSAILSVLDEVTCALRYREKLLIEWQDCASGKTRRGKFAVYGLSSVDGQWRVFGRTDLCGDSITLRLDDIAKAHRIDETYNIPLSHMRSLDGAGPVRARNPCPSKV